MNGEPQAPAGAEAVPGPAKDSEILKAALNGLCMEIEGALDAAINPKQAPWDHSAANWASEIGHPCLKHLVHCRLDWRERKPMDAGAMWRIKEGIELERRIRGHLSEIGFELVENQKRFTVPSVGITGRIDGLLPINHNRKLPPPFDNLRTIPAEIKSINPNYWDSVQTTEDLRAHKGWWIRKYPSQLNCYNAAGGYPAGLFILGTYGKRPRVFPMILDMELAEHDFTRAAQVNAHVAAKTYPEPMPYEPQACEMCSFNHLCQPLKASWATTTVEGADIAELESYLRLKEEFDGIRKRYEGSKARLIGDKKKPGRYYGHNALCESIEISSKTVHRKGYTGEETDYIQTTIERIGD